MLIVPVYVQNCNVIHKRATQRATAKLLGVDQKTVSNDLREDNSSEKAERTTITDKPSHGEDNSSPPVIQDAEKESR